MFAALLEIELGKNEDRDRAMPFRLQYAAAVRQRRVWRRHLSAYQRQADGRLEQ